MKRVAWACAIALLAFGNVWADESARGCPADIDLSNSAWVLREIQWFQGGTDHPDYISVRRVFAYQEDPQKRMQMNFHPRCWGETYSFMVSGYETIIAKRIVSVSGTRAFLLESSGVWMTGSRLYLESRVADTSQPSYSVLLYKDSNIIAHRRILLPVLLSNPARTQQ